MLAPSAERSAAVLATAGRHRSAKRRNYFFPGCAGAVVPRTRCSLSPTSAPWLAAETIPRQIPQILLTATDRDKKRSEEHTSELQSHLNLVCRLLLEKKKTHAMPTLLDHPLHLHSACYPTPP